MEIFIALVVIAALGYFYWTRTREENTQQEPVAPYKVEVEAPVVQAETKPAEAAPVVVEQPKVEEKPAKKPRTTKPKAAKVEAKPKAETKPKATKKPKMKVAK